MRGWTAPKTRLTASQIKPGTSAGVAPGATVTIPGAMRWDLPVGLPTMVAIIRAAFVATSKSQEQVRSELMTFVLLSQLDALETFFASPGAKEQLVRRRTPSSVTGQTCVGGDDHADPAMAEDEVAPPAG